MIDINDPTGMLIIISTDQAPHSLLPKKETSPKEHTFIKSSGETIITNPIINNNRLFFISQLYHTIQVHNVCRDRSQNYLALLEVVSRPRIRSLTKTEAVQFSPAEQ